MRSALTKLIEDSEPQVRIAAVDALDRLVTEDRGPLYVALQSSHLDARVRAAEVLSARRDEQIVMPMQSLVADKELLGRQPEIAIPLRQRAAVALASLGSPKLLRYFAIDLIKDEDPAVREQGAQRGPSSSASSPTNTSRTWSRCLRPIPSNAPRTWPSGPTSRLVPA